MRPVPDVLADLAGRLRGDGRAQCRAAARRRQVRHDHHRLWVRVAVRRHRCGGLGQAGEVGVQVLGTVHPGGATGGPHQRGRRRRHVLLGDPEARRDQDGVEQHGEVRAGVAADADHPVAVDEQYRAAQVVGAGEEAVEDLVGLGDRGVPRLVPDVGRGPGQVDAQVERPLPGLRDDRADVGARGTDVPGVPRPPGGGLHPGAGIQGRA
ncbi:hypothetical protein XF36_21675 [Pseudonocardia sp. HH130629-09]|nr:hypothetical protein XF36_21675 [Pseudonocardia sp. HH130629-09]